MDAIANKMTCNYHYKNYIPVHKDGGSVWNQHLSAVFLERFVLQQFLYSQKQHLDGFTAVLAHQQTIRGNVIRCGDAWMF